MSSPVYLTREDAMRDVPAYGHADEIAAQNVVALLNTGSVKACRAAYLSADRAVVDLVLRR